MSQYMFSELRSAADRRSMAISSSRIASSAAVSALENSKSDSDALSNETDNNSILNDITKWKLLNPIESIPTGWNLDMFLPNNKLEDFICPICTDICKDCSVLLCGHIFCNECIKRAFIHRFRCPCCQEHMDSLKSILPSPWHQVQIMGLTIKCNRKSKLLTNECSKQVSLRNYMKHANEECENRYIQCPLCEEDILASTHSKHVLNCKKRQILCELCLNSIVFDDRDNHYDNECNGRLVTCECKEDIKIKDMDEHVKNECVVAVHSCRFKEFGCDFTGTNIELIPHQFDEKLHYRLLETAVFALKKSNERLIQLWPTASGYKLPAEFLSRIESKSEVTTHFSYGPPEACMNVNAWLLARKLSKQVPVAGPKIPSLNAYIPANKPAELPVSSSSGPPRIPWSGFFSLGANN